MKKISLILGITILFAGCAPKPQQTAPKQAEWARGADLSWLSEMEHDGMLFYEPTETPSGEKESVDCISLLSSLGMNAVRLRVWVNHKTGWSNLPDMLGLAQRVSKEGLRLMVDIHYSDFFADPSHQAIPEAWLSYDYDALCEAVRNHTIDVLTALKNAGIEPEWVQIGNETPNGMLWPVARLVDKDDNSNGCWDRYAGLTTTGYKAAKEVFPDITVIVHVDNAYERRDWFWQAMKEHGGLWDMIGLSHYPMMSAWNGGKSWQEMNDLAEANIRHLIGEWQCPVMVAEIGMFNGNALSDTVMADFVRRATAIDSCAGIFYWEPECYGGWRPAEYIPLGWGSYDMGAFTDEGQPSNVMKILLTSEQQ
ncbi:MAG: glycosyl hydrolase 53 family protein [Paludibacteraceae bacterium]|nr:glycosyl hydrolase 53 family protein [Paludibacteraceae bacterium]